MAVIWEVTPEKIDEAVRRIVATAHPRKVILFGSAARGETHRDSDADFLVIVADEMVHPRNESVRIRSAMTGIIMSMDILVISEKNLARYGQTPGLVYRQALEEGKVLYDAAA